MSEFDSMNIFGVLNGHNSRTFRNEIVAELLGRASINPPCHRRRSMTKRFYQLILGDTSDRTEFLDVTDARFVCCRSRE